MGTEQSHVDALAGRLEAVATARSRALWEKYLRGAVAFRGVPMGEIRKAVHRWWAADGGGRLPVGRQKALLVQSVNGYIAEMHMRFRFPERARGADAPEGELRRRVERGRPSAPAVSGRSPRQARSTWRAMTALPPGTKAVNSSDDRSCAGTSPAETFRKPWRAKKSSAVVVTT